MTQKSPTSESIKAKLTSLALKLDRDFFGLSLEFAIERLVARLQADTKLAKHVIFKGGFVMLKCYGSNRTTIDLDTSVQGIAIEEAVVLLDPKELRDSGVDTGGPQSFSPKDKENFTNSLHRVFTKMLAKS